jgi:hypothetical protein
LRARTVLLEPWHYVPRALLLGIQLHRRLEPQGELAYFPKKAVKSCTAYMEEKQPTRSILDTY